ncbi:MAG: response regulator [Fischerella sp.]|jgi:two-component system chemotaxis response regulator CheB|uniref:chemotaxis protein CheB n=1 Tax=Fischerella sp. TaxID=1191 RepID=UPI0017A662F6|nr:chemotaxis protein CheB [Fischerella sp.]NWF59695.1 response regulator [Fischerella sp.]
MQFSKKKVVLIEDSPVALEILQRLLNSSPDVDVVGTARDGVEGLEVISQTNPDVICTDLLMDNMDGLELTKRIMAEDPRPILVISNFVQKTDIDNVFRLLQAGAADVFPKPSTDSPTDYEKLKAALIAKIKVLSSMKVTLKGQQQLMTAPVELSTSGSILRRESLITNVGSRIKVICIGASTAGLQTIQKILSQLPSNFPLPVICTLHLSEGILSGLVNWLSSECQLRVKIAQVGEYPLPGTVYFAPEKHHLELDSLGKFAYAQALPGEKHCPSITITFKSIANFYSRATVGVLLSGLGSDGAEGLQMISQVGGMTIAQNEKSGAIFGMVKEAIALGAAQNLLEVEEIAPFLLKTISDQ